MLKYLRNMNTPEKQDIYSRDKEVFKNFLFFTENKTNAQAVCDGAFDKIGNLSNIFSSPQSLLLLMSPLSQKSVELIEITRELKDHLALIDLKNKKINSVSDAKNFCKTLYTNFDVEKFYCICLDKNNKVLGYKLIASGS